MTQGQSQATRRVSVSGVARRSRHGTEAGAAAAASAPLPFPAALLDPQAMDQFFKASMQLAVLPPEPEPAPSESLGEEQEEDGSMSQVHSDDEDDQLARLLQVLPDMESAGGRCLPPELHVRPATPITNPSQQQQQQQQGGAAGQQLPRSSLPAWALGARGITGDDTSSRRASAATASASGPPPHSSTSPPGPPILGATPSILGSVAAAWGAGGSTGGAGSARPSTASGLTGSHTLSTATFLSPRASAAGAAGDAGAPGAAGSSLLATAMSTSPQHPRSSAPTLPLGVAPPSPTLQDSVSKAEQIFAMAREAASGISVYPGPYVSVMPKAPSSAGGMRSSMPLMPSQKAFLALQEAARKKLEDQKAGSRKKKKTEPSPEAEASASGPAAAAPKPRAGSAPVTRPVSAKKPAAPGAGAAAPLLSGAGSRAPGKQDFVVPRGNTSADPALVNFRTQRFQLDQSLDTASDSAMVSSFLAAARKSTGSAAALKPPSAKAGGAKGKAPATKSAAPTAVTSAKARPATTGGTAKAPTVSRPASAVVSEWSRPVSAGKTGLESRVAMQQAKQEAIQAALVSLAPLQYKAQRPLSGAVRITNPSDPAPTHRAASNLGARPATAPDGPLPSHRQPGGRYAAGAPGAAAFASLLTQSPSPASSTSMGFAGARPSTAAAAVNSSNSNSTSNPGLNSNHKLSASGTPTGAAALPAVAQAWPMPAGQGKEAILEARLLEDEEAGVGPAAVSAADRPGEVGRLLKRYRTGDPSTFLLTNSIRGIGQLVALADLVLQLPDIRCLCLASNDINDITFEALALALTYKDAPAGLEEMDLTQNQLSVGGVQRLLPLLNKAPAVASQCRLTQLMLGSNPLGDTGAELLAAALRESGCTIKVLDLRRCHLTERSCSALGSALASASSLRVMDLSWNSFGIRGARLLSAGMKQATGVEELYLAWTGVGDEGASHLAQSLVENSSIQLLDLSGNQLSVETCLVLTEVMQVNERLTSLILRDNPLGQAGARRLLRAMRNMGASSALQTVDLLGCGLQSSGPHDVAAASGNGSPAVTFNPNEPDGVYDLDLSTPSQRQVAIELLHLAGEQGLASWAPGTTLNGKRFKLVGTSKLQIPDSGALHINFQCSKPIMYQDTALSDEQFRMLWTNQVQPQPRQRRSSIINGLASAASALRYPRHLAERDGHGLAPSARGSPSRAPALTSSAVASHSSAVAAASGSDPAAASGTAGGAAGAGAASGRGSSGGGGSSSSTSRFAQQQQLVVSIPGSDAPHTAAHHAPVQSTGSVAAASTFGNGPSAPGLAALRSGDPGATHSAGGAGGAGPGSVDRSVDRGVDRGVDVSDDWKMGLLVSMVEDCYFTSHQLRAAALNFTQPSARAEAILKCFGVLTDPENLHVALSVLDPASTASVRERLGPLLSYNPANPTGTYSLVLSHPVHRSVARRLLIAFRQHYDEGWCTHPYHMAFTSLSLDGDAVYCEDPHTLMMPRGGTLKIHFVDLRPIPPTAKALSVQQFQVLVGLLVSEEQLDPLHVIRIIDDPAVHTSQDLLRQYTTRACSTHSSPLLRASRPPSALGHQTPPSPSSASAASPSGRSLLRPPSFGSNRRGSSSGTPSTPPSPGPTLNRPPSFGSQRSGAGSGSSGSMQRQPSMTPSRGPSGASGPGAAMLHPQKSVVGRSGVQHSRSIARGLQKTLSTVAEVPPDASVTGYIQALRELSQDPSSIAVRDRVGFLELMRAVAVKHYVTCDQLIELMSLLPGKATQDQVELVTMFWARAVDRARHWTDVMRKLDGEGQVLIAQRLGYFQIFNHMRPALHYRLRMWRPDEHEVAWQLFNLSLNAPHTCFQNLQIDNRSVKVNQGPTMWTVMRGSAADNATPTVTIDFDFDWPEQGYGDPKTLAALRNAITAAKEKVKQLLEQQQAAAAEQQARAQARKASNIQQFPIRSGPTGAGGPSSFGGCDTGESDNPGPNNPPPPVKVRTVRAGLLHRRASQTLSTDLVAAPDGSASLGGGAVGGGSAVLGSGAGGFQSLPGGGLGGSRSSTPGVEEAGGGVGDAESGMGAVYGGGSGFDEDAGQGHAGVYGAAHASAAAVEAGNGGAAWSGTGRPKSGGTVMRSRHASDTGGPTPWLWPGIGGAPEFGAFAPQPPRRRRRDSESGASLSSASSLALALAAAGAAGGGGGGSASGSGVPPVGRQRRASESGGALSHRSSSRPFSGRMSQDGAAPGSPDLRLFHRVYDQRTLYLTPDEAATATFDQAPQALDPAAASATAQ